MTEPAWRRSIPVWLGVSVAAAVILFGWAPSAWALLSGVILAVSLLLMQWTVGVLDLRHPTHLGFFYILYLATVYGPSFAVARDHPTPASESYLLAVHLTLLTVPAGAVVANLMTQFRRSEIPAWFARPVERQAPSLHMRVLYATALGLGILLSLEYLREAPAIPLFEFIKNSGDAAELVLLREESFKLLDSPLRYAFDVQRRVAFPFLISLALGWWLVTRRKGWLLTLVVSGAVGVTYAALSLAKMPPAAILLVCCAFLLIYAGGRATARQVVMAAGVILAFPILVVAGLNEGGGLALGQIVELLLYRMFYLPAQILYYYFEIFPEHMPYLHGLTIGRVAALLGDPGVDVTNVVFQYMYPDGLVSGAAPAAFIGALHADFGLAGVVVGGLVLGGAIQLIQILLLRRRKTVPCLAAAAFIYWGAWQFSLTAMPETFLSGGILLVVAAMFALEWGERGLSLATRPSSFHSAA